jgi:hypothetical protein
MNVVDRHVFTLDQRVKEILTKNPKQSKPITTGTASTDVTITVTSNLISTSNVSLKPTDTSIVAVSTSEPESKSIPVSSSP